MPPKITVCSPTMSPARTDRSAISFLLRAPTMPLRPLMPTLSRSRLSALRDRAAERQSGAAGRIFFEAVVRFDNLHVVIVAEHLGRFAQKRNQNIHAQAGVRRQQRRCAPRQPFDLSLLFGIESGGGDDHGNVLFCRGCADNSRDASGLVKSMITVLGFRAGSILSVTVTPSWPAADISPASLPNARCQAYRSRRSILTSADCRIARTTAPPIRPPTPQTMIPSAM